LVSIYYKSNQIKTYELIEIVLFWNLSYHFMNVNELFFIWVKKKQ